jgi:uncharacterized membrane-anchored protein
MASDYMNDFRSDTLLSKVPAVTLYFWVIKVLCTTVGETAADFLDVNLNFGLTGTSLVTGALLAIVLFFQLRARRYIPSIYWLTVALVSVFGTLVTDNLTDKLNVPLEVSTIVFAAALAVTFSVWYYTERTLSIHSIRTRRREGFYWLAILFTFALGTASGDLMAESLGLGYAPTGLIIAGLIALFAIGWRLKLNPVLSFWCIYILTRPLGASIGDYLSQSRDQGGLDLGASVTSYLFVASIVVLVAYLSITKQDTIGQNFDQATAADEQKGGLWQTVAVVSILTIAGGAGYHMRQLSLQDADASMQSMTGSTSPLGDLSTFRTITQDTLDKLDAGDQRGATARIRDLETEWDKAEARLKPKDSAEWTKIDDTIDAALRQLRAVNPNAAKEKTALQELLGVLT